MPGALNKRETLTEFLNSLQSEHSAGFRLLLIVGTVGAWSPERN